MEISTTPNTTNNLQPKETWAKPEITLLSINEETLTPLKVNSGHDFMTAS